jgi:hypothetical protein
LPFPGRFDGNPLRASALFRLALLRPAASGPGWLCNPDFNRCSLSAVTTKLLLATDEIFGSLILAYFQYILTKLRRNGVIVV